jgi:1-acyl-sn-glycerol-3-phosphate acyltransferase
MKEHRRLYEFARPLAGLYVHALERLEVEGLENIPPTGPVILVANHINSMDIVTIALPVMRQTHYMAKVELFRVPVVGGILRLMGSFPVRRGESDRESLRVAEEVLHAGQILGVFPEGHRSGTGKMAAGLPGVALIAMRTGAPLVPVAITGTECVLKGLRIGPWAAKVHLVYGKPFHLPPDLTRRSGDLKRGIDFIMRQIAALLPPEYRGVYAEPSPQPVAAAPDAAALASGGGDLLSAEARLAGTPTPPVG